MLGLATLALSLPAPHARDGPLSRVKFVATMDLLMTYRPTLAIAEVDLASGSATVDTDHSWIQQNCADGRQADCNGIKLAVSGGGYEFYSPNGTATDGKPGIACAEMSWTHVSVPADGPPVTVSKADAQIPHALAVAALNASYIAGIDLPTPRDPKHPNVTQPFTFVAMNAESGEAIVPIQTDKLGHVFYSVDGCTAEFDGAGAHLYATFAALRSEGGGSLTGVISLTDPTGPVDEIRTPPGMPTGGISWVQTVIRDKGTGKLWGLALRNTNYTAAGTCLHICSMPSAFSDDQGSCNPTCVVRLTQINLGVMGQRYFEVVNGYLYAMATQYDHAEQKNYPAIAVVDLHAAKLVSLSRITFTGKVQPLDAAFPMPL
jgi:hypothetical protein